MILNKYRFGSRVYGTATETSDNDYILVVDEFEKPTDKDVDVLTVSEFQSGLDAHDISVLECFFLPQEHIIQKTVDFEFKLDKWKLRESLSYKSSTSWSKAQKKLTLLFDYEPYIAIKSAFHSLRILEFGIQIAKEGRIVDYSSVNYIMEDLRRMSTLYSHEELWTKIDKKYRSVRNQLASTFKALCPKDVSKTNKKAELEKLLEVYGVRNSNLVNEIFNLFM